MSYLSNLQKLRSMDYGFVKIFLRDVPQSKPLSKIGQLSLEKVHHVYYYFLLQSIDTIIILNNVLNTDYIYSFTLNWNISFQDQDIHFGGEIYNRYAKGQQQFLVELGSIIYTLILGGYVLLVLLYLLLRSFFSVF